uniref:Pilus assembly protein n=1 Tax=Haemonchus contortus TaxID=6289 RepID=A0A7I4Z5B1_HAECO
MFNSEIIPMGEAATTQEEASEPHSDAPLSVAQGRREERYCKLSAIKRTYAVVEATAISLAKLDTDEATTQLEELLNYLQLAAGVAQFSSSVTLAVRPELAQTGGKPQLTKIPLYRVIDPYGNMSYQSGRPANAGLPFF